MPENGLITFDYVINTRYITYSICLNSSYSGMKKKYETIVIILMCWRHQWMIQNEELILFLSSNVVIRFKVYHSNCLSEEETKKKKTMSILYWMPKCDCDWAMPILLFLPKINRICLSQYRLHNLGGLFIFIYFISSNRSIYGRNKLASGFDRTEIGSIVRYKKQQKV